MRLQCWNARCQLRAGWLANRRPPAMAHAGTLPPSWGGAAAFQRLAFLSVSDNRLSGSIPADWAGAGAFASLAFL